MLTIPHEPYNDVMQRQYKQYISKIREGDHHEETTTNNTYIVVSLWNVL